MKKQKKSGVLYTLFLVLLLIGVSLTGTSEAEVQLVPRVNASGQILHGIANEDYVVFGKFDHRKETWNGSKETSPTPIIWRVMSADAAPGAGQKKAILLTHYLVDAMVYDSGDNNPWSGSGVQVWVNKETAGGFLEKFSILEKGAMMSPSPDGIPGTKATLPSGSVDNTVGGFNWGDWAIWSYENSDIKSWFGDNDYQSDKGAGVKIYTNARKAHFKGASFIYDTANNGWYYWTRSPVATLTNKAWYVDAGGHLNNVLVNTPAVAVRPACFLNQELIIFKSASNDFDLSTSLSGEAGKISNPYVLVLPNAVPTSVNGWATTFISADKAPNGAKINGKALIVSWDVAISPAVRQWPILTDFTLTVGGSATEHPTSVTSDDANPNSLKLTFATGVTAGATVTLSYNLNTDAISHDSTGTPVKVVDSFANLVVSNDTPSGGGGGGGTTLSKATTPSGVGATLGATPYAAQTQPDGTYLITLPSGTDLKAIKINMTLPTGATISPDLSGTYNFASENPKKFTITAQDGTTKKVITIRVIAPAEPPTEKTVLTTNASDCAVIYTRTSDGTIAVEIRIPFISGITPSDLESLMLALKNSGLSNIRFSWVDANGNVVPYRTATNKSASVKAPYLQITGNAPSVASLANEAITKFSYKTKSNTTQYVQTYSGEGLKLSAMNVTDNTKESSGSSGCNAGAGSAGLLAMGMVLLGLNKAGARKKK